MTRVIAASEPVTIVRGDDVEIVAGLNKGEWGTAICVFRTMVTVGRPSGYAVMVPLSEVKKREAAIVSSDLETTQ